MWATTRRDGFPEPTLMLRLPRLSSWKTTRVGAALRMADRTCPSCPATPPTEASARTRSRASSMRSARARDHAGNTRNRNRSAGLKRAPRSRCVMSILAPGSCRGAAAPGRSPGPRHGTLVVQSSRRECPGERSMAPDPGTGVSGVMRRLLPTRLLLRVGLAVALVLAGLLTLACIDANWRFAHLEAAAPARVFSAPFVLSDGVAVVREDLQERLARLGYRKIDGHPGMPGEYSTRFRALEIYLNAFDYPAGKVEATPVRVKIGFGHVGRIENLSTGETLDRTQIEP